MGFGGEETAQISDCGQKSGRDRRVDRKADRERVGCRRRYIRHRAGPWVGLDATEEMMTGWMSEVQWTGERTATVCLQESLASSSSSALQQSQRLFRRARRTQAGQMLAAARERGLCGGRTGLDVSINPASLRRRRFAIAEHLLAAVAAWRMRDMNTDTFIR